MNSDLKAQLRELNITAAKVKFTFFMGGGGVSSGSLHPTPGRSCLSGMSANPIAWDLAAWLVSTCQSRRGWCGAADGPPPGAGGGLAGWGGGQPGSLAPALCCRRGVRKWAETEGLGRLLF